MCDTSCTLLAQLLHKLLCRMQHAFLLTLVLSSACSCCRLHDVAAAFDDTALLELARQHTSSLQHLSLTACKGISWKGVVGLKVGGGR